MFLRAKIRHKDGKAHRAWSVVENRRVHDGRVVQRQVLYLGEINDSQRAAWSNAIEVFDEGAGQPKQIALFPEDRIAPALDCDVVSIRLSEMRLRRPRQWGACWMATLLWDQLRLDEFWFAALPPSREGTNWLNILKTLVGYQLISPGSEWRLHRHWFEHSAMGDLLGEDLALVRAEADCAAPMGRGATATIERLAASLGGLDEAAPRFDPALDVSKGGVLLALPALLACGLLRHSGKYFRLPGGFYGLKTIFSASGLHGACSGSNRLKRCAITRQGNGENYWASTALRKCGPCG